MPSGPRIRANSVYGLTTDAPLSAGATAFNSAGLANLPAVASAHAIVTLDALREFGEPEIVVVTSHTASATVATITRAQYGTAARSHPVNTTWVHAPLDEDLVEILTAATRPSDPYEGQFIFETDTNKLVGYGGVDWAPRDAGGQLGYAQVVTNQNGIGTSFTDLTSLAVAVTVGTGRRIRISSHGVFTKITSAGSTFMAVFEGAVQLQDAIFTTPATDLFTATPTIVLTPSAGAHTYKLAVKTTSDTVNLEAAAIRPAFILVEDIGAA